MSLLELKRNLVYKKIKNTTCLKNTKRTIEYTLYSTVSGWKTQKSIATEYRKNNSKLF